MDGGAAPTLPLVDGPELRFEGVLADALQRIADANGGTRAEGTPGYAASVDYVLGVLAKTGWNAEKVPFSYQDTDALLRQLTPTQAGYETIAFTGMALTEALAILGLVFAFVFKG